MMYLIWNKTFGGMRFVDVWGVSPETLGTLPGIELLLDNISWGSVSVMFKVGHQRGIVEQLVSLGAVEYHPK